jgi:peptide deformylase
MALLSIVIYPDKRLTTPTKPVTQFDAALKSRVKDLFETMYKEDGSGLAANQVGIDQRILVIDVSERDEGKNPVCLINPKIVSTQGKCTLAEGCLSFPGLYLEIERSEKLTVEAQDQEGKAITLEAEGWLARALQHEIDHLDGKTFIERISRLKRQRVMMKYTKRLAEAS